MHAGWNDGLPRVELTKQEQMMMKRLTRVRALFAFRRQHRHDLFDGAFQDELPEMYRDSGAGDEPHPPAMLCMALSLPAIAGATASCLALRPHPPPARRSRRSSYLQRR